MTQDEICTDCVIVGGGASGMMAAITAAQNHASVLVIEHTARVGSKILQTGNGKCNFTNLKMGPEMYQNGNPDFVDTVLQQFGVMETLDFFRNIGVYNKAKNGYVYPHSETAASLQDALRLELERLGICVWTACEIHKIARKTTGGASSGFVIQTNAGVVQSKTIILATGSKAAPKTGSDGSGYALAAHLGHRVLKPLPALVQLVSSSPLCKMMAGVRSTGRIVLAADKAVLAADIGEIQYTDYGVSGIPVFQISRHAVLAVDLHKKVQVRIDMLPDFEEAQLMSQLQLRLTRDSDKTMEQFFSGLLNKKLVAAAVKKAGADSRMKAGQAGAAVLRKVLRQMKEFELDISGFKSFENAQVCQGGVALAQIVPETMGSTICKGLFFAGEIVDVDGKCGGYNLQWAWSSGYVAGKSAAMMIQNAHGKRENNVKNQPD